MGRSGLPVYNNMHGAVVDSVDVSGAREYFCAHMLMMDNTP